MRSLKPVHKIIASLRASLHFSTIKSTPPRAEEPAQSRSETCNSGANNHRQGSEMHKASSKLACTHCHQSPTVAFFVSSDSSVLCRNPSSAPGVPLGHSAETGSLARVGDRGIPLGLPKSYCTHRQDRMVSKIIQLACCGEGASFF